MKRINASLPDDMFVQLQLLMWGTGQSITDCVRSALQDYLTKANNIDAMEKEVQELKSAANKLTKKKITVTGVKAIQDYQLLVSFSNGKQKYFNVKPYLNKGMYKELLNKEEFAKARYRASDGTVEWPNGLDIAPHDLIDYSYEVPI